MYKQLTDEQLQTLAVQGDTGAEDLLARRYIRLVRICARPYFLSGGDSEDLIQEGMLGLLYAIREYDAGKGASFHTFAEACIHNRIQSAIRSAARKKHAPLNDGVSLDQFLSDDSQSLGDAFIQRSPEEQVLARETETELLSASEKRLSALESRVLSLYLSGLSYQEMAAETGRDPKAIDNAVQRIRKKLANLPSGDYSKG